MIPNILVIGETGSGKSSLINKIIKSGTVKESSFSLPVTQEHDILPWKNENGDVKCRFYDTRGFERGKDGKEAIRQIGRILSLPLHDKDAIHAIWYLVDLSCHRIDDFLKAFCESVPYQKIFVLLSKADKDNSISSEGDTPISRIIKLKEIILSYEISNLHSVYVVSSKRGKKFWSAGIPRFCREVRRFQEMKKEMRKKKDVPGFRVNDFQKSLKKEERENQNYQKHMLCTKFDDNNSTIHCSICQLSESACPKCHEPEVYGRDKDYLCRNCNSKWMGEVIRNDLRDLTDDTIQVLSEASHELGENFNKSLKKVYQDRVRFRRNEFFEEFCEDLQMKEFDPISDSELWEVNELDDDINKLMEDMMIDFFESSDLIRKGLEGVENSLKMIISFFSKRKTRSRYHKSGKEAVSVCFDVRTGKYLYPGDLIQVAKGTYEEASEEVLRRIELGQFTDDIQKPEDVLVEGEFTIGQVECLNDYSVTDAIFGLMVRNVPIMMSGCSIGLTNALKLCLSLGSDNFESVLFGCLLDTMVATTNGIVHFLENLECGKLGNFLSGLGLKVMTSSGVRKAVDEVLVKAVGYKGIQQMTNVLRKVAGQKKIYGAAAKSFLSKRLRDGAGTVLKGAGSVSSALEIFAIPVDVAIKTGAWSIGRTIDIKKVGKGKMSTQQFTKNATVDGVCAASGLVGGIAGFQAGTFLGAALGSAVPVVGNVAGGMLGGAVGGYVGGVGASKLTKLGANITFSFFMKEDEYVFKCFTEIYEEQYLKFCNDFVVSLEQEIKGDEKRGEREVFYFVTKDLYTELVDEKNVILKEAHSRMIYLRMNFSSRMKSFKNREKICKYCEMLLYSLFIDLMKKRKKVNLADFNKYVKEMMEKKRTEKKGTEKV